MIRRSLARRIALSFIAADIAAVLLALLVTKVALLSAAFPFREAAAVAAHAAAADLIVADDGRGLAFSARGNLHDLQRANPALWAIARNATATTRFGPVPPEVERLLDRSPSRILDAEIRLRTVPAPLDEAVLLTPDYDDTSWRLVAGGIDPSTVGWWDWLVYLTRSGVIIAIPLSALLAMPPILLATWWAMRGLRPTLRAAAAITPDHLERRLDQRRAPRELWPLVRAINSALDRLGTELARKQRFIADASHELRTPVAILGMRIAALPPSDERRELERAQVRLAAMIAQMLDVERIAMRRGKGAAIDLVKVARQAVAEHAPLAIAAGYTIALTGGDEGAIMVAGEAHVIDRVLANVVGNAVAHGGGGGLIEVRVAQDGTVVVADEGPGIPPAARERVFEAFHRERWDRDGCGLGLHLVRQIMQALGGQAAILDGPGCRVALRFRLHDGTAIEPPTPTAARRHALLDKSSSGG